METFFEEPIPTKLNSLYFDDKFNKTRQYNDSFRNEDNILTVSEPGNEFLTHVTTVKSGSSVNVATAMFKLEPAEDILQIKVYEISQYFEFNLLVNLERILYDNSKNPGSTLRQSLPRTNFVC